MLAYYYAQLQKKKEEVARLIACQSTLQGKQSEFQANEHKCLEPELSASTWHGTLATGFQDIREAGIHTPFLDIAGAQFSKVFTAIADKINSLNAEIISLEQTIARLEAEARAEAEEAKSK
ncbi:DUF5082 domain-containing protein [Sporosarcina sp. ANT_H38]|uniref:DUF5082 domain-containing protein n=1 Tax=Sporosarcina sp. ANT_H38 TaxID=2597358 RepID=UPI0011F316F9|nr:DUF5082 domain-containing protein [Sporosarcina sp. ANT_H38]KAA0955568.1 DUF5082 domain-containing protein [Sporosarcina sp. ANT_H38]